ncbi:hypothetical protein REPUB_Repub05bG0187500 [Reevesia pubescens]
MQKATLFTSMASISLLLAKVLEMMIDPNKDPKNFNLVGLTIRRLGGNSYSSKQSWFMHCHLEVHTRWGSKMAWIVLDGKLPDQKLLPPPADLPKC